VLHYLGRLLDPGFGPRDLFHGVCGCCPEPLLLGATGLGYLSFVAMGMWVAVVQVLPDLSASLAPHGRIHQLVRHFAVIKRTRGKGLLTALIALRRCVFCS
jgi:hypothetical protein